jgi:multiple sugar transport system substrate-binding protein
MKKILSFILIATMALTLVTGCSKASAATESSSGAASQAEQTTQATSQANPESISFMYQGTDRQQAAIKAAAEKFTAQTGIKVELNYAPHDVYQEQLSGAIASKKVADIVELDAPFLANLVWSGVLSPIEQYLDADLVKDMTASNVSQCTYPIDNKLYAISHIDSTVLLYANKKYLAQIGARIPKSVEDAWTIEEFETYLAALSKIPEVKYPLDIMRAYGVKSEWGTYGFFSAFVSNGGGIIDSKTYNATGTLNGEKSVEVAKKFQTWVKNGWVVPASAGANLVFNEKREAAIAWCGNWFWAQAYPTLGDDLIALPLPNFGQGVKSPNGTWLYAISADAKKEAAGKFISFMLKDEDFLKTAKEDGEYPGLKSWAATDPTYSDPNKMLIAAQQANTAVARPQHPAYPIITGSFMDAFASILDGADVQSSLDKAAKLIDDDIKDNDGYPPFGQ